MTQNVIEILQKFGLNLYEAKAYAALLEIGTANPYKISKVSEIPRARIYDVLEAITKRGFAMIEESSENTKLYTPVPSNVVLEKIKKEWQDNFEQATSELQALENEIKTETYVFTVKGSKNIVSYCRNLLKSAKNYVMLSAWEGMYKLLSDELYECQKRGCKVLGIGHDFISDIDGIEHHNEGKIHNMPKEMRWFVLSADGERMLYGYSAEMDKDAFYTEDISHIYLMEDYILHDVIINRLSADKENKSKMLNMMQEFTDIMKIEKAK